MVNFVQTLLLITSHLLAFLLNLSFYHLPPPSFLLLLPPGLTNCCAASITVFLMFWAKCRHHIFFSVQFLTKMVAVKRPSQNILSDYTAVPSFKMRQLPLTSWLWMHTTSDLFLSQGLLQIFQQTAGPPCLSSKTTSSTEIKRTASRRKARSMDNKWVSGTTKNDNR